MWPQGNENQGLKIVLVIGVACSAMLLALFGSLLSFYGGYADRRFGLVVLITLLLLVGQAFRGAARGTEVTGWVLFCLSIAVSIWLGRDAPNDFVWAEAILFPAYLLSVFGFSAFLANHSPFYIKSVLTCILAGAIFYALLTPSVYLFALFDGVSRLDQFLPWGFVNIRYWSQVASWILPLLPLALLINPLCDNRLWRLGAGIAAAIWWWLLLMSSARGSALSILVGGVFVSLLFGRHAGVWLCALGRQLLIGGAAWLLLSVLLPLIFLESPEMRTIGTDTSGRIRLWQEAWAMSLVHFPFGMGGQSWLTHDIITSAYETGKKMGHPHNMYLMWAAEYGWFSILGLTLMGSGVVYGLFVIRSRVHQYALSSDNKNLIIALTASTVASACHAGASSVFMAPASMLVGLMVLSLFRGALNHPELFGNRSGKIQFSGKSLVPRYLTLPVVLSVLLFWNLEVVRYYQAMTVDRSWYGDNVPQSMQPRFWAHGNFPRNPELMPQRDEEAP
ncbi:O-antigen ligase family protein [uncultured Halovibrio sp.]|uniref:O-antigen ligase family protein n=2 Tax=Gammaproteobacteria TaxID=1236 RepID=UPI0025E5F4FC|nr:O-antigen ligase family protein [uncultured Halovibrio sp.]